MNEWQKHLECFLCTRHCFRYFRCINSSNNKWLRTSSWNSRLMTLCNIFSMKPSYLSKKQHCSGDLLQTMGGTWHILFWSHPLQINQPFVSWCLSLSLLFLPCHINWTELGTKHQIRLQGIIVATTMIFITGANTESLWWSRY